MGAAKQKHFATPAFFYAHFFSGAAAPPSSSAKTLFKNTFSASFIKSGSLVIANSAEVHACENFGTVEVCCIIADADILGKYCGVVFENYIENDEEIHRIFEDIKAAFSEKSFSEFLYASDIYALLAVLLKKYMRRGFSDHSYFSHRFKKHTGISPASYRNAMCKNFEAGEVLTEKNICDII